MLYVALIGILTLTPFALLLPKGETHPAGGRRHAPFGLFELFKSKRFVLFMVAAGFCQSSHAVLYSFGTLTWRGAGIDDVTISALWGESVAAEILMMLGSGWLLQRLGVCGLIGLGLCCGIVRWTGMAFTTDVVALIFLQALHAGTFAASHLGAMAFIQRALPASGAALGQSIYYALGTGLTQAMIFQFAGILYARYGQLAFLGMTVISLAALPASSRSRACGAASCWSVTRLLSPLDRACSAGSCQRIMQGRSRARGELFSIVFVLTLALLSAELTVRLRADTLDTTFASELGTLSGHAARTEFQNRILSPMLQALLRHAFPTAISDKSVWFALRVIEAVIAYVVLYLVARRLTRSRLRSVIATVLVAYFYFWTTLTHPWEYPSDFFDILFVATMVWLALEQRLLSLAVVVVVTSMNRESGAFGGIIWMSLAFVRGRRDGDRMRGGAVGLGLIALALLAVWALRNWLGDGFRARRSASCPSCPTIGIGSFSPTARCR